MRRESLALVFLRYVFTFGMFAFMAMLYWSSALLEEDVQSVQLAMNKMVREMESLRMTVAQRPLTAIPQQEKGPLTEGRKHARSDLPNLLTPDPFYETTLPKILGASFVPHGTLSTASFGTPHTLHPFTNWSIFAEWNRMCSVTVATGHVGKYETYAPFMAMKMEERRHPITLIPEYWVHLRDNVYWEPLEQKFFPSSVQLAPWFLQQHRVTAHDFKLYFDAVMNPYVYEEGAVALRTYLEGIEEFRVIDDFTFAVRWQTKEIEQPDGSSLPTPPYISLLWTGALRPLASFVYNYFPDGTKIIENDSQPDTYRTNSVWAQNFQRHWANNVIVSCGPWAFDGLSSKEIHFRRNNHFFAPLACLVEGRTDFLKESLDGEWQAFKGGQTDYYTLRPDLLHDYEQFLLSPEYKRQERKGKAIERLDFLTRAYAYVGWNQARPLFKSTKVRQALTMAIDRKRIIDQILNGMGVEITGSFFYNSPAYNHAITPWPFDPLRAKFLLQEEGWFDTDGDGILDKEIDGVRTPFRFSLLYYVKNSLYKSICEFIATALREIGIDCQPQGVDLADLSAYLEDKNFDALALGWALGTPPEDPRQLWYSTGATEKGSSNIIGFANAEVDAIINTLEFTYDHEERTALYHRFDEILHEKQPYTFLYTPKSAFLYREYVNNVFIPAERHDLIPGADIAEPETSLFYLEPKAK